jgi:hypothetical protein
MFDAVSVRSRKIRSGRSGAFERCSIAKNAVISAPDGLGRRPPVLGGVRQGVDEDHQARRDRCGTREIEPAVAEVGAALAEQPRRDTDHEQADRHVDEEDP